MPSLQDAAVTEIDFLDASFFQRPSGSDFPRPQLPSPAEVRARAEPGSGIVRFEHLSLLVKFGPAPCVRLEEAHATRVVSEAFDSHEVPVPEVFGWRIDGKETFIYMSLIEGSRLSEAWPTLTEDSKTAICMQLRGIVACLRKMKQSQLQRPDAPSSPFIGSILGTEVQDIFFHHRSDAGPFHSVAEFNDGVQARALPNLSREERAARDPYRSDFPDSCGICFTHGDIHLDNIIVEKTSESPRIVGLIDWGMAGWYPEYWEYCKLHLTGEYWHEWREKGWAASITDPWEDVWWALAEYWVWVCP